MSHDLYTTRLYWCGMRGVAKLHGVSIRLTRPPVLGGVVVDAIDYVPEVRMATVMFPFSGWREMTRTEVKEADAYLRSQHNRENL